MTHWAPGSTKKSLEEATREEATWEEATREEATWETSPKSRLADSQLDFDPGSLALLC